MKKKKQKKSSLKKSGKSVYQADFEEIEFICSSCGKKVKMIKNKGYSTEGLLCQRCSFGEEAFEDDN